MGTKPMFATISLVLVAFVQPLFAEARIEHWQSRQGSQVYYVYTQGLPLVDLRLVFDAGSARDGEQFGIAALTSNLLETGAGDWDADQIAQRFEGIGATFGAGVSTDIAWLSLRTLSRADLFDKAIETMAMLVNRPTFSTQDFDREKNRTLAGLKHREELPSALASIAFQEALYDGHPYAHPAAGFIRTVNEIQAQDLKAFHKKFYVAANATVVIVGDLSRKQAEQTAEKLLSGLEKGQRPEVLPIVPTLKQGKTEHIEFPSEQTHVFSGMPGIDRKDKDYFPLVVGNHILGGSGLVSRIFKAVREDRGLAYSAYSYFSPRVRKGPFTMGLQTRNDQADEALKVLIQTLTDFIDQGPSEQELDAAKKNITGGFVLRFDTNKELTEYIAMIAFNRLPLDYLERYPEKVAVVTRVQIQDAFKRRVLPALLQTITVGSRVVAEAEK